MTLPVNVDASYLDSAADPSVALHQQHHDAIHAAVNGLPSTYLPADTSGVTDGQLFAWSAALGHAVPVAALGAEEIGLAENVTGTATAIASGGSADIPLLAKTVGPDTRDVWATMACLFQQTTVGTGTFALNLVETTSGAVTKFTWTVPLPNTTAAGLKLIFATSQPFRLGPLASARTFKVVASIGNPGGSPAGSIFNSAAFPSWLRLDAR